VAGNLVKEGFNKVRGPGRAGVPLAALLIPALVVYGYYRAVINPGSLRQLVRRLGNVRG
jgi:hypothetical protein